MLLYIYNNVTLASSWGFFFNCNVYAFFLVSIKALLIMLAVLVNHGYEYKQAYIDWEEVEKERLIHTE